MVHLSEASPLPVEHSGQVPYQSAYMPGGGGGGGLSTSRVAKSPFQLLTLQLIKFYRGVVVCTLDS